MSECIFCDIVGDPSRTERLAESQDAIAFADIATKAPVHVLVIPKRHISGLQEIKAGDKDVLGSMLLLAAEVAEKTGIAESGYRVSINAGAGAGQVVFHLHMHVLGGWEGDAPEFSA